MPGTILRAMRAGRDPRRRLARRGAAAAAMVADAVFHLIGVVGVAGAVLPGDLAIVLGALVDILDQHRDRRAGRDHRRRRRPPEDAGEDLHLVGLAALGDEARLAGPALVEFALDVGAREADAGRAAVDHAAERGPVALAPGGDAKEMTEGVVRHGIGPGRRSAGRLRSIGVLSGGQTAGRGLQETVTRNDYPAKHWRHRTDTRSG